LEGVLKLKVHYFSTQNRISPFVAMIGPWTDRAAMVRTIRAGVKLGSRDAIQAEIDLYNRSTRCVAVSWPSVKELLWDHQEGPLSGFYPGLIASIRKHSWEIRRNLGAVAKKQSAKNAEHEARMVIVRANRMRIKLAAQPQMQLFQADFEAA
jgi:hypothetical protein